MKSRIQLFTAASAAALLATGAMAQTVAANATAANIEELVVTGSRGEPRSKLDTIAPVDVVSETALTRNGTTELAQALAIALPSLNFTRPAVTDGTDTVRPATLRGLSPDETLVLVNSKRAHAAALVNLNGSIGYGSGAVDLNTIPTVALAAVEVLRDGASAQYGSDAIAGVINLRLREASSGGFFSVTYGQYDTDVETRPSPSPIPGVVLQPDKHRTDGGTTTVTGWQGLPLFGSGFLTLSAEAKFQQHTTRAGPDPRQQYPLVAGAFDPRELTYDRYNNWYGDPKLDQYTGYANAGYDLSNGVHLYGWGSYQFRDAFSAANVRRAIQENAGSNIISVYPNGFLPKIEGKVTDSSLAGGATGKAGDWAWDASVVWGRNEFHFGVTDSLNASLGPNSPREFDAGRLIYQQTVGNLGLTRTVQMGAQAVNLAAGVEIRGENYQIKAGEPASYVNGGFFTQPGVLGGSGAQSFSGFSPANATDKSRTSESVYGEAESKFGDLDLDGAARYEHYSDFGDVVTGKLGGRYDLTSDFALRASVSNGFRAPSLQQSFITTTSTNFVGGLPVQTILLPPSDPRAALIGASPLKPERSTNVSGGGVFRSGGFSLTVDAYYIKIKDRIVLSDILQQANVIALFRAGGVNDIGGVRFFTNGADSETKGVEAVANYRWRPDPAWGAFDFSASASHNETSLTRIQSTPVLSALTPAPVFLPHYRTATLTDGQPKWKGTLIADWTLGPFGVTAQALYYGKLLQPANTSVAAGDYTLSPKTLVNLEGRWTVAHGLQFAVGADNLLDTYPTTPPYVLNGVTISSNGVGAFPEYSPFGFQGRFVYARVSYSW
ncbi:TonB-dependent receptor [Phenylobacterium sp.]|jgi:iron complex outermembrane receptor protein|uniref:TonB-dependent receptor plug domain-containing protein n=1 Tax=Phenylobacterium sp. TaxID=1871053 RepID=UPI002E3007F1|nr:TonB-dependent receptor [Phenylobacterium sp.]HEX4709187.1 TonB-dependent receptor [Phenylobacterium sp.]